jgi:Mn2+/Fe2+ NRAMP family transporter
LSQVANGVLIPLVLVFMLILVNKAKLMGEFRNGAWQNAVAVGTSVIMIGLTGMLVWNSFTRP